MHLANDYTRPYGDGPGARSRCRIRVYRPDDRERDAPVVIASELAGNPGAGVTDAAEFLAAEVMTAHLFDTFVWIEHRPPEATAGRQETFALVVFAHYYVPEQVVIEGTRCKRLGKPTRKRLDRATVEAIVGQKV
jgi:hypothetical protein